MNAIKNRAADPVVDRAAIPQDFVSRLLDDILKFGEDVQIQATDESGHSLFWTKEQLRESWRALEIGRVREIELHYFYSGHLWRDLLNAGSRGMELTRNCLWDAD